MELVGTVVAVAFSAAMVAAAALAERRRRPLGEVSMVPWPFVMLLGMVGLLFGIVHLLTLAGRAR